MHARFSITHLQSNSLLETATLARRLCIITLVIFVRWQTILVAALLRYALVVAIVGLILRSAKSTYKLFQDNFRDIPEAQHALSRLP